MSGYRWYVPTALESIGHPRNITSARADVSVNDTLLLALTPKMETKALEFIQHNPISDGRGIVIGILDTGVDPGAPGLQRTSDGKVKIIERYDCSGAGDVDTSTVVREFVGEVGRCIKALTGRDIKICPDWNNPSGDYHVGFKPLYELYPDELQERMMRERRIRFWDPMHALRLCQVEARMEEFVNAPTILPNSHPSVGLEEKFQREDMLAQYNMLVELDDTFQDLGPVLDCVVFKDIQGNWKTYLTLGPGHGLLLGEYNTTHQFSPIMLSDYFNVSVNVWDDGNLLEIVGISGDHGTHVAAIAAGNFPDTPNRNGVAPGAQIISLAIGDNRLGSQETSTAFTRAMARAMRCPKIHIFNTSYGESSAWVPHGKIAKMICEMVDKHGLVWTSAAGNDGPALSTVESPAWICEDCLIGVGAYVSSAMMPAQYSRSPLPGMLYPWSARGPSPDGRLCISVCAPGGAITSVPNYTLRAASLMNGTSMAAPHCAGCIALMLSKAIQENVAWTPYSVKRSLENSAIPITSNPDPLGHGCGLIQVPNAYYLLQHSSFLIDKFVRYSIECDGNPPGHVMRGIYIRNTPLQYAKEYQVSVTPVFFRDQIIDPAVKINFTQDLNIYCDATWVKVPSFFTLQNETRHFPIEVESRGLLAGAHYAKVYAVDAADIVKGPLFSVDVIIIIPTTVHHEAQSLNPCADFGVHLITHGQVKRYFARPPIHASRGVLSIKVVGINPSLNPHCSRNPVESPISVFSVQALTLIPGHATDYEQTTKLALYMHEEKKFEFSVVGGKIVEIALSRSWAETDSVMFSISAKFYGITIDQPMISASTSEIVTRVELSSHLSTEQIEPAAVLTKLVQLLQATDMHIHTLGGPREEGLPGSLIYELRLTFKFTLLNDTEVEIESPFLSHHLYESEYLSQLWMLYTHTKQYLAGGDAYSHRFTQALKEGEYTVRMHVRHTDVTALHRLMVPATRGNSRSVSVYQGSAVVPIFPVHLKMTLTEPITLNVFTSYDQALFPLISTGTEEVEGFEFPYALRASEFMDCYLRVLLTDKELENLPSRSGFCLEGTFKASNGHNSRHLGSAPLKVFIPRFEGLVEPTDTEEEPEQAAARTPSDHLLTCQNIGEDTSIEDIDEAINYCVTSEFFGVGVKLLIFKYEKHRSTWSSEWHGLLRDCYRALRWTHCLFFLDANWLVQSPPNYRVF